MRRTSWDPLLGQQVAEEFSRLSGIFDVAVMDAPSGYSVFERASCDAGTCQGCERQLLTRSGSRWCSLKCRFASLHVEMKPCLVCGKALARRDGQGRQRLYCGAKCKRQAHRKPRAEPEANLCRFCAAPMQGATQKRYCNRRCKAMAASGKDHVGIEYESPLKPCEKCGTLRPLPALTDGKCNDWERCQKDGKVDGP